MGLMTLLEFKSDRCGIETIFGIIYVAPFFVFKSDRCGIETIMTYLEVHPKSWFKSDRCGIETKVSLPHRNVALPVQIRPLRD